MQAMVEFLVKGTGLQKCGEAPVKAIIDCHYHQASDEARRNAAHSVVFLRGISATAANLGSQAAREGRQDLSKTYARLSKFANLLGLNSTVNSSDTHAEPAKLEQLQRAIQMHRPAVDRLLCDLAGVSPRPR